MIADSIQTTPGGAKKEPSRYAMQGHVGKNLMDTLQEGLRDHIEAFENGQEEATYVDLLKEVVVVLHEIFTDCDSPDGESGVDIQQYHAEVRDRLREKFPESWAKLSTAQEFLIESPEADLLESIISGEFFFDNTNGMTNVTEA